ncbi:MAG TPA: tributyrin esterase [Halothiobacillaceae bacterium]|nr:tributyrin esterase [Halothiobacillaceae bacterium]
MLPVVNAEGLDLRAVSAALKGAAGNGPVVIQHAAHLAGLCAGMGRGEFTIEGDSGDYLGVLNDGATIRVKGNAGQYLADGMTRGTVVVEGNAGYGAGAYCYGGTIVVDGNAGDFAAVMNKGATIVVNGDVGDEVATYMLAGDLVITGNAGNNLGNYLIRGNIYIGGDWASLGHNTLLAEMTAEDVEKVRRTLEPFGIEVDARAFKKIVRLSEKPFYKAKAPVQAEQMRA